MWVPHHHAMRSSQKWVRSVTAKSVKKSFKNSQVKYDLKNFYDNILEKLCHTDILIARAGAGTINDVIITQIPTIFVPLPNSSNNHQYQNAQYLQNIHKRLQAKIFQFRVLKMSNIQRKEM